MGSVIVLLVDQLKSALIIAISTAKAPAQVYGTTVFMKTMNATTHFFLFEGGVDQLLHALPNHPVDRSGAKLVRQILNLLGVEERPKITTGALPLVDVNGQVGQL